MKRTFKKEELLNLDLPFENVLADDIIDQGRWSTVHKIVFQYEDKFYQTTYSVGSTECQEERPWENEKEVECWEVIPKEKKVICWERKEG